jgi:hypothetical protein
VADQLIRKYYACFNERRVASAESLFAPTAVLDMPPFVHQAIGPAAYTQFATTWLGAFPDAQLKIDCVEQRSETMCEVNLIATGTHAGALDLGPYGVMHPSGVRLTLRLRELLDIRSEAITYAAIEFDINHLVKELQQVDYRRLAACLTTVEQLFDELLAVEGNVERQREVTERLGLAIDAARHAARPQFNR